MTITEQILLFIGDLLQGLLLYVMFLYVPFCKTWKRAILVPFILSATWGGLRTYTIYRFKEPMPPMIGFYALPFFVAVYAVAARALKILIFMIPFLNRSEQSIRRWLSRKWSSRQRIDI